MSCLLSSCQSDPTIIDRSAPETPQPDDTGLSDAPPGDTSEAEADLPRPECVSDPDCPQGQICAEGVCVEGCRFDGACGPGEVCEDDVCLSGCRNPADCPVGQTCREGSCVTIDCTQDEDCGQGNRCRDDRCQEVGDAPCVSDDECGFRWRCSTEGLCHDGDCLAHRDCESSQWCRQRLCVHRGQEIGAVSFQRVYPSGLSEHFHDENALYGAGGGLFDLDTDRDLDVFLGSWKDTDSPPCVYRNISEPGEIAFEAVDELCGFHLGRAVAASGVDLEADGRDELVILGEGIIRLERFHPERQTIDLIDLLESDDPRRNCEAGSMAATDLDLDGRVDLLVGCQSFKRPIFSDDSNLAFRQTEDGDLEVFDDPSYAGIYNNGVTVSVGVIDANDDGLLDIFIINDSFIPAGEGDSGLTSGEALVRNAPGAELAFAARPFGRGNFRIGSYMGIGNVHIDGLGDHQYITDYGPNRLIQYGTGDPRNLAVELGIDLGYVNGALNYSWSAVVDDFDRNGLDDIFVSQGVALPDSPEENLRHRDTFLFQRAGGDFVHRSAEAGLGPPTVEDSRNPNYAFASRGAVKADLDGDGLMEILIAGLQGVTKVYSEKPTPDNAADRCTLVPRSTVVPASGLGYAVAAQGTQEWRRHDMQGNLRFGASPWVMTTVDRGVLRFPSGCEVNFNCRGGAGPIPIREPQWIDVSRQNASLQVSLTAPWLEGRSPQVTAAIENRLGQTRTVVASFEEGQRWTAPITEEDARVMVRVADRWIPRWFEL